MAAGTSPSSGSPPSATRAAGRVGSIAATGVTSASSRASDPGRAVLDEHEDGRVRAAGDQARDAACSVGVADRAGQLARGEAGEPALALLGRAGVLDQRRREHGRQERDGGDGAPELLAEDRELDRAEALAAVLLGDGDAGPAELGELLPEAVVGAAGLGVLADALGVGAVRRAARARCAGSRAGRRSVRSPCHATAFSRGRPRTRSATMFLSTSVVPPSIELPRARSSS